MYILNEKKTLHGNRSDPLEIKMFILQSYAELKIIKINLLPSVIP